MKLPLSHVKELRHNPSLIEKVLWHQLRNSKVCGLKFRRQVSILKYIVDFYCHEEKLIIEADGSQHFDQEKVLQDRKRDRNLKLAGYTVLRFGSDDILKDCIYVIQYIEHWYYLKNPDKRPADFKDVFENRKTKSNPTSRPQWKSSLHG